MLEINAQNKKLKELRKLSHTSWATLNNQHSNYWVPAEEEKYKESERRYEEII